MTLLLGYLAVGLSVSLAALGTITQSFRPLRSQTAWDVVLGIAVCSAFWPMLVALGFSAWVVMRDDFARRCV